MERTNVLDTLGYFEKLKAAGIPESHAKAQVDVIREVIDNNLATKQDMKDLRRELKELELRLTIRLGGMLVVAVGVLAALVAILR